MKAVEMNDGEILLRRGLLSEARLLVDAVQCSYPEMERYLPWASVGYDLEAAREFLSFAREEERTARGLHLSVFHLASGELIGGVGLMMRSHAGHAELGYWLRTDFSGRGYTTDASALLLDYGFSRLGLRRVFLTCDVANKGSRRVAEKLGMRREGRLREYLVHEDRPRDHWHYAILAHEFKR
ncbi:MAG: GNAT family N-acetyltransferase [bacterium]|nr:GNAT family N-acetyltransferase [bacterium]